MQRPVHVLAHVDDGRPTDLVLPEAVSDAGAVIVAADDHARLMFLNRIPPPRMPFNHRTGCGEPRARRWFVHDPKLPRRVAVVFEQSWQPEADMRGTSWQPIHLRDDKTHRRCLRGREHAQTPSEPLLADGSDLLHADIRGPARTPDLDTAAPTWPHGAAQRAHDDCGRRGLATRGGGR